MKTIAICLALFCSSAAALRADTVLIYDTAFSTRLYGSGTATTQTQRLYLLFDYTTSKTAIVSYFTVSGKKRYGIGALENDDFLRFSVRTSPSASATYFHIASDVNEPGGFRQLFYLFMNGTNKLMDLGGGHTGNFPPKASGVIRGFNVDPGSEDGAVTGNIAIRLVPALTTAANTANASLEASIQIVTADLERRGYTRP